MKFIKGFLVSIAIYVGLSILFYGLEEMSLGHGFITIFSGLAAFSKVMYVYIADPTFTTVFQAAISYINPPPVVSLLILQTPAWIVILGDILPIALAALIGSIVERKSGSTKYIFFSTFIGLLVIAFIGIAIQVLYWPASGGISLSTNLYLQWEWFMPGTLIMAAINAFVWCAIGLFITNKGWG